MAKFVSLDELKRLQQQPDLVRNVCILAHVDHGKTTLADTLIASNGIISRRLAGTLRYMDSREDEQQRGITMKSSSITLKYSTLESNFLINLIDSPGHVDFSSEVSTAVRLCDGCIVVVDVVEGVCPQTHAVLRQVWQGKITPVLVLNKIDRLITELNLTPLDAYHRLLKLLEEINCVTASLFQADMLNAEDDCHTQSYGIKKGEICDVVIDDEDEEEQSKIYFAPQFSNVVFASSIDGWGFTVKSFAEFFSKKLGFKVESLLKTLWGNYYANFKQKKILNNAWKKGKKPLFVQLILENIWSVYEAINARKKEQITKICTSLGVKLSMKDTQYKDPRPALLSVMSQWLPLSDTVLSSVCQIVPPPTNLPDERVLSLFTTDNKTYESWPEATRQLKQSFSKCSSSENEPVIVYVSKMVPYDRKSLPENRKGVMTEEEMVEKREQVIKKLNVCNLEQQEHNTEDSSCNSKIEHDRAAQSAEEETSNTPLGGTEFVAFARIFSGTVRKGQELYVLGPKHDPNVACDEELETKCMIDVDGGGGLETTGVGIHALKVKINNLYVLMGRELEMVDEVPAGNLLGISGLGKCIIKSATVSSTLRCPAFTALTESSLGIIRVAVNTPKPSDLNQLIKGLKLLNQADTNVQVLLQETGEHVLLTAGEVHLERCLKDLEEFAQVPIMASDPIVPYRETIIVPPKIDRANEIIVNAKKSETFAQTIDSNFTVKFSAKPLPQSIFTLILDNPSVMKVLDSLLRQELELTDLIQDAKNQLETFIDQLKEAFDAEGPFWSKLKDKLWTFGPNRVGPCILFNMCSQECYDRPSLFDLALSKVSNDSLRDCDSSISHGFQLATSAGPLCEEPMMGVAVFVHDWTICNSSAAISATTKTTAGIAVEHVTSHPSGSVRIVGGESVSLNETGSMDVDVDHHSMTGSSASYFTPLSGRLISASKDAIKRAIQLQPCRLMEAMYKCEVTVSSEKLGSVYAVLNRRRGLIVQEDMTDDLTSYYIEASLPVEESFGFVSEMRLKTSGRAYPQLVFSHWALIQEDPFWVPTTEEEKSLYGDVADTENFALKTVTKIRTRKGLSTHCKVVEFAEKQRNLSKKK